MDPSSVEQRQNLTSVVEGEQYPPPYQPRPQMPAAEQPLTAVNEEE